MSTDTVRGYITAQIEPHLPGGWKVEDGIPTLGTLSKPVLWIEYTAFEPFAEAPLSKIQASADLCIVTNKTDSRKGEDEADEIVAGLYEAVIVSNTFYRITARKAVFNEVYFGWRMSIEVITTNPATTAPTEE